MTRGGRRPGAGRPPSGITSRKKTILLHDHTWNTFEAIADRLGIGQAELLRRMIDTYKNKK